MNFTIVATMNNTIKIHMIMLNNLKRNHIILVVTSITIIIVVSVVIFNQTQIPPFEVSSEFPDFFTSNEDYFVTRIGPVPNINRTTYQLEIKGRIENPANFTLEQLQSLNLTDLPLTTECIGNPKNGELVATAVWRGFNVFELLETLGISENATGVRYLAADGYYASHTLDQLMNNGVLGALYMNGVEIPPVQGFPLRILNPGYYGVKQPAWVTEIEVIDRPLEDYWQDRGWDTSPPMDIDTKIFFPEQYISINVSQNLQVGGCAYGGTRIKKVEFTFDDGVTWNDATIVQQIDADNVWVFWQIDVSFNVEGQVDLQIRAIDINDNLQSNSDIDPLDGTSLWSRLRINVI